MKTDFEDYKEMMYDVRRAIASEKEKLAERTRQVDGFMRVAEKTIWPFDHLTARP